MYWDRFCVKRSSFKIFIFALKENNKFILQNDFEYIIFMKNRCFDVPQC